MSSRVIPEKINLHPRNRHRGPYEFEKLKKTFPELSQFVLNNKYGDPSIDFANPLAVKCLNRALLRQYYSVEKWDIPSQALCPPIPGRADLVHYLADLISREAGEIKAGASVRILDIGVGANCIYPLIGNHEYQWSFVGSDINSLSIKNAEWIVRENHLDSAIALRLQKDPKIIFSGIILPGEQFEATICNPPFHRSLAEAQAGSARKWQQLGRSHQKQTVNFGGEGAELWCEGGELKFIESMIHESHKYRTQVKWFTSLVSKVETLKPLEKAAKDRGSSQFQVIDMAQGQKKSRLIAWKF